MLLMTYIIKSVIAQNIPIDTVRFPTFTILSYTGRAQIVYNFKDMKVYNMHMY